MRGGVEHRVVVLELGEHLAVVDLVRAVEGDQELVARVESLQPVHPVGEGGRVAGSGAEVVVPARPGPGAAGEEPGVGVQRRQVGLVADGAEDLAFGGGGVAEQVEALVGVPGEDHRVEGLRVAVVGADLDGLAERPLVVEPADDLGDGTLGADGPRAAGR